MLVYMYVCMYVYMYVYMYICMYVCSNQTSLFATDCLINMIDFQMLQPFVWC